MPKVAKKTKAKKNPEVGKEIEAHCKPCKADTVHVITTIKDDVVKKVMCKACNATHVYKPPVDYEEAPKPKRGRPKKTDGPPKVRRRRKADWGTLMGKIDQSLAVDYSMTADYGEIESINHKKFGVGIITKILAEDKIQVVFEENTKILAQNWEEQ